MRRRKQKNPLLMRIVGVSVLVHIIALPILAKFGAFKKIQKQFLETQMVVLPAPAPDKKEPEAKKKIAVKPAQTAKKSTARTARQASQKSNLSTPKVVASAAAGGTGSGDAGVIDANGSGKAGQLPTVKTDAKTAVTEAAAPAVKNSDPPKTEPVVKAIQNSAPPKENVPIPKPAAPSHEVVFIGASAVDSPQPTIPDNLRADTFDKDFKAEITISMAGLPTDIKITKSTGNDELDRIALETAKQWRFKPATRDGQPTEDRLLLHIEFQVN